MNYVTTNLRLPEDLYLELKMEAARSRKSLAQVARERMTGKKKREVKQKVLFAKIDKFAKEMSRKYPDLSLSQKLIEMRYEQ